MENKNNRLGNGQVAQRERAKTLARANYLHSQSAEEYQRPLHVEERTEELRRAYEDLRKENADHKRMEHALKQSEERYRVMLQDQTDFVCRFRTDGRVTGANDALAQLVRLTPKEIIGRNFIEMLPDEETRQKATTIIQRISANNPINEIEQRISIPNGPEIWVEWRSRGIFGESGELIEIQSVGRDITERKRLEVEKEKLEAQNRQLQKTESLGRMAGAVAHHFNNQLHVVLGGLEMALRELPQTTDGPVEFLNLAMQATRRASELSSLMLTYLGQTRDKRERVDISSVCRLNMPILQATMPKNVVLRSDFPCPGLSIEANQNQLQQVLTNLVANAWDAAESTKGVVTVSISTARSSDISELHRFPIDAKTPHELYACLEVADTGCGIAEQDIEKLFDPFYSSKFTGRGMGLAVVLGIVRSHKGVITVDSKPNRGSIFRVYFPAAADGVPHLPKQAPIVEEKQNGGTVLLVEDEEMIRTVAAVMLKGLGFTVLSAEDGVEAVELFRQHLGEIRWVLCDLSMPRMNGWETLEAVRRLDAEIPVVLASGYSKSQVMEGVHPELPQAFLNKPYGRDQLCEAIRQAFAHEKSPA